jgi:hypothetical protein
MILKQLLLTNLILISLLSCNNESKPGNDKTDSATKKETLAYPLTASYSLRWQPGG